MDSNYKTCDDIFQCRQCGECCSGFGGTYVTQQDMINISLYLNSNPEKFIDRYCDTSGSKYVLTLGKDGRCIFFDTVLQCTIHPVKPYMCKAWPFIRTVIKHPENWNAMANSCPGMKKDIPSKDLKRIVSIEKDKLDKTAHL